MRLNLAISIFLLGAMFPTTVGLKGLLELILSTDYAQAIPNGYAYKHVSNANLSMTGITWMFITIIGIRAKKKWAWYFLVFLILWVGLHDLFAVGWLYLEGRFFFPVPAIPLSLGLIGLFLSSEIVRHK